jgi:predicted phage terminase large subunit-like protein
LTQLDKSDALALGREAKNELSRRRLLDYCTLMDRRYESARHLKLLADRLEALERRDIRRLIVAMPPRHGKSRMCSQLFPSWLLGRRPEGSIVLASYGSELAEQNSRRVRELLGEATYPFEAAVSSDSRAVNRWQTTAGGVVIAAGVGSALTGFGADAMIVDDPIADRASAESPAVRNATWDWFSDVARTRLHAGAIQLLIATRWHEDDPTGRILNSPMAKEWEFLSLPALRDDEPDPLGRDPGEPLWPERYPASELPSVERGEITSRSFAALYQQRPVPAEGHVFKTAWFENRYTELPSHFTKIVCWLDAAAKTGVRNDYSAIVKIGVSNNAYFILDVWRDRVEFPGLIRRVGMLPDEELAPSTIYVEDTSNAVALIQAVKSETHMPIVAVPAKGSKESRAEGVTGVCEAQKVFLPREASWLTDFERELFGFPAVKNDDMVDAFIGALSKIAMQPRAMSWTWGANGVEDIYDGTPGGAKEWREFCKKRDAEEAARQEALLPAPTSGGMGLALSSIIKGGL